MSQKQYFFLTPRQYQVIISNNFANIWSYASIFQEQLCIGAGIRSVSIRIDTIDYPVRITCRATILRCISSTMCAILGALGAWSWYVFGAYKCQCHNRMLGAKALGFWYVGVRTQLGSWIRYVGRRMRMIFSHVVGKHVFRFEHIANDVFYHNRYLYKVAREN